MATVLQIKNMVCDRCILVIRQELNKLGLTISQITLGEVIITQNISNRTRNQISEILESLGFELLDDYKTKTIEKVKALIINLIHYNENRLQINLSDYLSKEIGMDYSQLSQLFSLETGLTIERFLILQKIEKTKELLDYNELSIGEIANKLHYSSVAHLSNQFKKITGMTPSQYKKTTKTPESSTRKALDQIM